MEWVATEVVLAAVLLVVIVIAGVYARRRVISRDGEVLTCGFRPVTSAPWRPCLLRMSTASLQVFPLFGISARPSHTWSRRSLDLSGTVPLEDVGGLSALVDQIGSGRRVAAAGISEDGSEMTFDLALGQAQYTAVRYWVEGSPPAPAGT